MNPIIRGRSLVVTGAIALLPAFAAADAPITFSSNRGAGVVNLQSDGTARIDSTFTFEVGAFSKLPDGSAFVPTPSNVGEWGERWNALAATGYNEAPNNFFTGSATLDTNVEPFSAADVPYIWGFDSREGESEWILIRRDGAEAWSWPDAGGGGITPSRTFFTVSDTLGGLAAVVGEFNGAGFLMKTASVSLPAGGVNYSQWAAANFNAEDLANPEISGETADPDLDGFTNFYEFATGTLPQRAASSPVIAQALTGAGGMQLSISENPDALVTWELEVSSDLEEWDSLDPAVEGTSDGTTRTFEDPTEIGALPRRFFRISVKES